MRNIKTALRMAHARDEESTIPPFSNRGHHNCMFPRWLFAAIPKFPLLYKNLLQPEWTFSPLIKIIFTLFLQNLQTATVLNAIKSTHQMAHVREGGSKLLKYFKRTCMICMCPRRASFAVPTTEYKHSTTQPTSFLLTTKSCIFL